MKVPQRKRETYRAIAQQLVVGDGPRTREQIVTEVERSLLGAYEAGLRDAWPQAREAALREVSSAIDGACQGLRAQQRTVDLILKDLGTLSE